MAGPTVFPGPSIRYDIILKTILLYQEASDLLDSPNDLKLDVLNWFDRR